MLDVAFSVDKLDYEQLCRIVDEIGTVSDVSSILWTFSMCRYRFSQWIFFKSRWFFGDIKCLIVQNMSHTSTAGFIFHSERAEMSNTDLSCILGCSVCAVTDFLVKLSLVMDD